MCYGMSSVSRAIFRGSSASGSPLFHTWKINYWQMGGSFLPPWRKLECPRKRRSGWAVNTSPPCSVDQSLSFAREELHARPCSTEDNDPSVVKCLESSWRKIHLFLSEFRFPGPFSEDVPLFLHSKFTPSSSKKYFYFFEWVFKTWSILSPSFFLTFRPTCARRGWKFFVC